MAGKTAPKKRPARKRVSKKKRGKSKAPLFGFSFLIVMVLLIIARLLTNVPSDKKEQQPEATQQVTAGRTQEVAEAEIVAEDLSVDNAIKHAAELLGVLPSLVSQRVREGVHTYSLQLDRDRIDLTLANMILTGNIENAGGVIISGEEVGRGSAQVLTVKNKNGDKDYSIRLSYARSGVYTAKKPKLVIIVDDFGEFGGSLLDEFMETDINVTFAILPHLRHSREVMDRAVAAGREVVLHIPMEPLGYPRNNPGINPILVEHSDRDINRTMEGYMRHLPSVSGANNHMGSLATTDERVMNAVLKFLHQKELYFIDSRTTSLTVAFDMAQKMTLPSAGRDMFLDVPDSTEETVRNKLRELRGYKEQGRDVVVITHCFDRDRLNALNKFIEEAKKIGYELVPGSKLFAAEIPEIL